MRSILNVLVATLLSFATAAFAIPNGRPTDAEIKKFAASRGILATDTSPVTCSHSVLDEKKGEATIIEENGERHVAPASRLNTKYEYLCMVTNEPWGFVGKLRNGGRLVAVNVLTGIDETGE